jgi:hypothetical protein
MSMDLDLVLGLYKLNAQTSYRIGMCAKTRFSINFHAKFIFVSFCMQEVLIVLVCLILCAIEFFEGSIECLYSFFS